MNAPTGNHWQSVYTGRAADAVSWYQADPARSLALIRASGMGADDPVIDVGGGASLLVDRLLDLGFRDVTVLDLAASALDAVRARLGERAAQVQFLCADVTAFRPDRAYALWHDRAAFHFLTEPAQRAAYVRALGAALRPGGTAIIATFGPRGPEQCSGLPVVRYDARLLARELGGEYRLGESVLEDHVTPAGKIQQFLFCRFRRSAPCPLPRRLAAMLYDAFLLLAVLFVATFPVLPLTGGEPVAAGNRLYGTYLLLVIYLYFVWQWVHGGRTLGMRAWRLRLVSESGARPGWRACTLRFAGSVLCWVPAGLGFLSGVVRADGRAWNDRLSGTRLVVEPGQLLPQ